MEPETNGHAPTDFDTEFANSLRAEIARRRMRIDELQAEIALLKPEISRYERALALIDGSAPTSGRPPAATKPPRSEGRKQTTLSEPALEAIRNAVLRYAVDHEEFRQVDIRKMGGDKGYYGSSTVATAFERLRQENLIRFARKEGNAHIYRLTRTAVEANAT